MIIIKKHPLLSTLVLLIVFVIAIIGIAPSLNSSDTDYSLALGGLTCWQIESTQSMGTTTNGSAKSQLDIYTALNDGDNYTATPNMSYPYTIRGKVYVSSRLLDKKLNLTNLAISKHSYATSAPLKADQKVIVYQQATYEKIQVVQHGYKISVNGSRMDLGTSICYVYRPISPQVSFQYQ